MASIHEKEKKSRRFKKEQGEVATLHSPLIRKPEGTHYTLSQAQTKMEIPNNWILLDTCSSGNFFKSRELLTELKKDEGGGTTVICNAGKQRL